MAMKKKIRGTVKYLELEGGFWGIIGEDGTEYRPVDMPAELQEQELDVEATLLQVEEEMSMHMWGEPVKVQDFKVV